jgi:hypothetical protein
MGGRSTRDRPMMKLGIGNKPQRKKQYSRL